MAEQNVRQADNKVVVEGILAEKRIEVKTSQKNEKFITGDLDIQVSENEVHTVSVFSKELKKDGSENGVFKGLETVMNEYKSIADVGIEEADKVRVTNGDIRLNEYYGQDEQLKSYPQINTNFINRVQAGEEFNPRAEFEVEVVVRNVKPETNKEAEETGRAVLEGYIPLFGGRVIPFTFTVGEEGAEYVQDNYESGNTVFVYGQIVNFKEKIVKKTEAAFGKDKETITYNTVREYLITGGGEPYDEENTKAYDIELIQKALVERETYLTEMKNRKQENKKEENKGGFGSKAGGDKKKPAFDKDKLPF
jgi:hypothetical protein